jgi:hypothetical protein
MDYFDDFDTQIQCDELPEYWQIAPDLEPDSDPTDPAEDFYYASGCHAFWPEPDPDMPEDPSRMDSSEEGYADFWG